MPAARLLVPGTRDIFTNETAKIQFISMNALLSRILEDMLPNPWQGETADSDCLACNTFEAVSTVINQELFWGHL